MKMSNVKMGLIEKKVSEVVYTNELIRQLEGRVLFPEKSIGSQKYYIENEKEVRRTAYENILRKVENRLDNDENLILKTIVVPNRDETCGFASCAYYEAIFLTNKRVLVYHMNFKYQRVGKEWVNSIEDLKLKEIEKFSGVRLELKDGEKVFLRSYSEADKELILIMLKILTEKGVKFYN